LTHQGLCLSTGASGDSFDSVHEGRSQATTHQCSGGGGGFNSRADEKGGKDTESSCGQHSGCGHLFVGLLHVDYFAWWSGKIKVEKRCCLSKRVMFTVQREWVV
jgi:hypothetical protein